eukprot:3060246-Rhodomonas_salina.1
MVWECEQFRKKIQFQIAGCTSVVPGYPGTPAEAPIGVHHVHYPYSRCVTTGNEKVGEHVFTNPGTQEFLLVLLEGEPTVARQHAVGTTPNAARGYLMDLETRVP